MASLFINNCILSLNLDYRDDLVQKIFPDNLSTTITRKEIPVIEELHLKWNVLLIPVCEDYGNRGTDNRGLTVIIFICFEAE